MNNVNIWKITAKPKSYIEEKVVTQKFKYFIKLEYYNNFFLLTQHLIIIVIKKKKKKKNNNNMTAEMEKKESRESSFLFFLFFSFSVIYSWRPKLVYLPKLAGMTETRRNWPKFFSRWNKGVSRSRLHTGTRFSSRNGTVYTTMRVPW